MAASEIRYVPNPDIDDRTFDKDKTNEATVEQFAVLEHGETEPEIDQGYLSAPKKVRYFRGMWMQMLLFAGLTFCGPSITDAISLLGGGGLKSPFLANLAASVNYVGGAIITLLGGPIVNKVGIKWVCVISAACYALSGSGYYAQARYENTAYLLTTRIIGGFTNALLYIGEATAMLSYPYADERGRYLGLWTAARATGTIARGAINFSTNSKSDSAGGIGYTTYIIFICFEAFSLVFALLLSPTATVRRRDGSRVPTSGKMSWKGEIVALGKHYMQKRTWLMFFPAFYSFFYGGVYGTYLTLHFSVRSRALSSMITPVVQLVISSAYGFLLDTKSLSVRQRAFIGAGVWAIPQAACFVWTGYNLGQWGHGPYHAYDYGNDGAAWARAYLPYLIVWTFGYLCQMYLHWILGRFATDVETASRTGGYFRGFEIIGQAVSYGLNSRTGDKKIPLYVNCAAWSLAIPSLFFLVRMMPEDHVEHEEEADADTTVVRGEGVVTRIQ